MPPKNLYLLARVTDPTRDEPEGGLGPIAVTTGEPEPDLLAPGEYEVFALTPVKTLRVTQAPQPKPKITSL